VSEKQVVFDVDGNPKELRYYEHDRLTARLGVILDGDKNFIGLRELDVAEVSPPSWLERLGLKKAVQPKRIDILTVDFIGLINWINTIKTIKTIENVDLIDRITLIDTITSIGTIGTISKIGDTVYTPNVLLINPSFEAGFLGWFAEDVGTMTLDTTTKNYGLQSLKMKATPIGNCILSQSFSKPIDVNLVSEWAVYFKVENIAATARIYCYYTDGTSDFATLTNTTTNWERKTFTPTSGKFLKKLTIFYSSQTYFVWFDDFETKTVSSIEVKQATRASLKVQGEREDLLCKSFDLTVGTTSLLAAVASQYHKVYGWDYESDTDGANEFSATISGATTKFARRVTKGVHAMTLVHPIVCDVNTALSFVSAGNTKLSLRYKTEA
jgi:hypothetical protein